MKKGMTQLIVLAVFVVFFGYLSYKVVQPFMAAIVWAVVLAIVSHPVYKFLLRRVKHEGLASLLNLIIILVLLLGPISYFMYFLGAEVAALTQRLQQHYSAAQGIYGDQEIERYVGRFLSTFGVNQREVTSTVIRYATQAGQAIAHEAPRHAMVVATTVLDLFLMSVLLFFLPSYGPRLLDAVLDEIPLPRKNQEKFKELVKDVVLSAIYGGLFGGAGHGLLALVAFAVAGVPSPVLLAISAAFTSLLPLVGSFVVWLGVVIYLFAVGRAVAAITLTIVAVLGTQAIDHLLRPWLSKGKSQVPFVVVLFGILGGLEYFGFSGFVLGPLVLAVFIALMRLFKTVRAEAASTIEKG